MELPAQGLGKIFHVVMVKKLSTNEEGNPRFCTNKVITFVVSIPRLFFSIAIVRSLLIIHKKSFTLKCYSKKHKKFNLCPPAKKNIGLAKKFV